MHLAPAVFRCNSSSMEVICREATETNSSTMPQHLLRNTTSSPSSSTIAFLVSFAEIIPCLTQHADLQKYLDLRLLMNSASQREISASWTNALPSRGYMKTFKPLAATTPRLPSTDNLLVPIRSRTCGPCRQTHCHSELRLWKVKQLCFLRTIGIHLSPCSTVP